MSEAKLPESCEQHQAKYHGKAWQDYTLAELGWWVHLFVKRAAHRSDLTKCEKDLTDAQNYLHMMQAHIDAAAATRVAAITADKEIEPIVINNVVSASLTPVAPPRDENGNVTRISTQVGDPGYDPEIHLNQDLKILCDSVYVPTAHTADTEMGIVWYYEKNAQGRIKTKELHGNVEIRGL